MKTKGHTVFVDGIGTLLMLMFLLGTVSKQADAQGLVDFRNSAATLISADGPMGTRVIFGPPGSYYFGLLTANPAITDPKWFTFTGVYATNLPMSGRISGGLVSVPSWEPGTARSFIVCGWPASAGPDFKPSWLDEIPLQSEFGMSAIGMGVAGGFDDQTGTNLAALELFGPGGVNGFDIAGLCLSCNPPQIMIQPRDQSVTVGMSVQFSVGVAMTPDLGCQWFCNGTVLTGETNFTLQLTTVSLWQNGNRYYAGVGNPWGSAESDTATLTVLPGQPLDVRWVPGLWISGQPGTTLEIRQRDALTKSGTWSSSQSLSLTATQQWWFDVSGTAPQRFYSTVGGSAPGVQPSLGLHMVPAITLTGVVGSHAQLDYVSQSPPSNVVVPLASVLLTNYLQLFFDTSAIGQPPRLWFLGP